MERIPSPPHAGAVWNGFEWVTPERYEIQRATTMPELPPLQAADHIPQEKL